MLLSAPLLGCHPGCSDSDIGQQNTHIERSHLLLLNAHRLRQRAAAVLGGLLASFQARPHGRGNHLLKVSGTIRVAERQRVVEYAAILYPVATESFSEGLEAVSARPGQVDPLCHRVQRVVERALDDASGTENR